MTNTVKHTPGPWEAAKQKDWRHRGVPVMAENGANRPDKKTGYVEPGDALVAFCGDSHVTRETAEANACLIAAAPELYAEARRNLSLLQTMLEYVRIVNPETVHTVSLEAQIKATNAVIAKAEGKDAVAQGKTEDAALFARLHLMRSGRDEAIKALQLAYDVMRGATLTKKQLETALKAAQKVLKEYN